MENYIGYNWLEYPALPRFIKISRSNQIMKEMSLISFIFICALQSLIKKIYLFYNFKTAQY